MKNKDLISEVEKIAEKTIDKKYQKEYKSLIIENYIKFLDNESREKDKMRLLKVLENVKWYSNYKTDIFFCNVIIEILNKTIGDLFIVRKNKESSSCYNIVINLLSEGKIEKENIVDYNKYTKEIDSGKKIVNSTILIVDDYSGSGETIINMIKAIEKKCSNNKVLILCYVWQEKAIDRIKRDISDKLKNIYTIIEDGIVIENSYEEKFKSDTESIGYIRKVCKGCSDEEIKYGYKKTGAMLTFNGISPNNNISMLWNNNIKYKNGRWIPVFNREYSLELLIRKKNEYLIKNKNEIYEFYNESSLKKKITYEEFKVLIILFNTYSIRKEYIKKALGFDTIEEVTEIIEKFVDSGIITYSIENILQFTDTEVIREMKKVDEKISRSVGIIKGTRRQINKNKPLE